MKKINSFFKPRPSTSTSASSSSNSASSVTAPQNESEMGNNFTQKEASETELV